MYIKLNDKSYIIMKETVLFSNLGKGNKSAYLTFYNFLSIC